MNQSSLYTVLGWLWIIAVLTFFLIGRVIAYQKSISATTIVNNVMLQVGNDPQRIRAILNRRDPKGQLTAVYENLTKDTLLS